MAKKVLSIVLAVVMLMSVLVVGASAAVTDYQLGVKRILLGGIEKLSANEATWRTKIASYESQDPDIVARNLAYWDKEVQDAYAAASTTAQWKALYNLMREGVVNDIYAEGDLDDFYPAHRLHTSVGYKYEVTKVIDGTTGEERESVAYAQPGDQVIVTVSVKTDFIANLFGVGLIYEFNNVTFDEDTGVTCLLGDPWVQSGSTQPNYGIVGSNDYRSWQWPTSMRGNKNGEFDTYKMVKAIFKTDLAQYESYDLAYQFDDYTPAFEFPFIINDDAADGVTINFFNVEKSSQQIEDLEMYESSGKSETVLNEAYRTISPLRLDLKDASLVRPDACAIYDQNWTFENATLTIGEEPTAEPADYTELDAAINAFDAEAANEADYTAATWAAYAAAAAEGKEVSRDLTTDDQKTVDDAADAITAAAADLAKNEVKSAVVDGATAIGSEAKVKVTVDGAPSKLTLKKDNDTITITAQNATITNNDDGTQTWEFGVFADSESATYEVYAKYANVTENPVSLTIKATSDIDLNVYGITVYDMYPENKNGGTVIKGRHIVEIVTGKDVFKIQFVDPAGKIESGSTYTYSPVHNNCEVVENADGTLTWTINHAFGPMGSWSMPIRTRAESTTFATTGEFLTARVVY